MSFAFDMKKYSAAPFWCTLLLGLLSATMSISALFHPWGPFLYMTGFFDWAMGFLIPLLILAESFLFGRFRTENIYTSLTWLYIGLIALAHASAFVLEAIFKGNFPIGLSSTRSFEDNIRYLGGFIRNIFYIQKLLFGCLLFLAHALFLIIFIKIRTAYLAEPLAGTSHLLDDFAP